MLTLKELKNIVKVADVEKKVPNPKSLRTSTIPIVVKEVMGTNSEITVYANGYVLYREENRTTVFPLHKCTSYEYESENGSDTLLNESFFDNENWYVRLIMEGTDLMVRNQEKIKIKHGVHSYSGASEEWEELKDRHRDMLEDIILEEEIKEILDCLSEKQQEVVSLYYLEELNQTDISKILGISQQSVCGIMKRAIKVMKNYAGVEE